MITNYSARPDAPKDIVIPDSYVKDGKTIEITAIGQSAFSGQELTSVVLNDNLLSIGNNAFSSNTKITSIVIPNSVTSVSYTHLDVYKRQVQRKVLTVWWVSTQKGHISCASRAPI